MLFSCEDVPHLKPEHVVECLRKAKAHDLAVSLSSDLFHAFFGPVDDDGSFFKVGCIVLSCLMARHVKTTCRDTTLFGLSLVVNFISFSTLWNEA